MRAIVLGVGAIGVALSALAPASSGYGHEVAFGSATSAESRVRSGSHANAPSVAELNEVVDQYCVRCHNPQRLRGNISLDGFEVGAADEQGEVTEKMIAKLRLGMMPPPGSRRPEGDTLQALAEILETRMDENASTSPTLARRGFQRLNRTEYESSILALLGLQVDAGAYLPPDTRSANFDNIADVQMPSATVIEGYFTAADEISRMAVGDPNATSTQTTYSVARTVTQLAHVEGAPRGTRGGLSTLHTFPADGEYVFNTSFYTTLTGTYFGRTARDQYLEISIDGERVALIEADRFIHQSDPTAEWMQTELVFIRAGQRRVSAAFLGTFDGPVDDIVSPIRESLADLQVGYADGMTILPHLWELVVEGPVKVTGVSENDARRRIFTCRPTSLEAQLPCAREIIERLAAKAYRRPLESGDIEPLLGLYAYGLEEGGFEVGVKTALQAILSSPDFIFRVESASPERDGRGFYRIDGLDLASRLSYFLWGGPPDEALLAVARDDQLSKPDVLDGQVRRMLADPRTEALSSRFASQWLRLQDLEKVHPGSDDWPDFEGTLRDAMLHETALLFDYIVREDRSVLDLLNADYTFVNEDLARHYDMPAVSGAHFRRVEVSDSRRWGLLGHGSVLVSTSHADRTSPVRRGKWVMEVLLDSPPPAPPPNVPELDQTAGVVDGRPLTVKERMEAHRANPSCNSCHAVIDPLGLALENFDVTGEWRIKDAGNPIDASGVLWDGRQMDGPEDLRMALVDFQVPFMRAFTKNLMAYALGRRVEYYDQPAIRAIARAAKSNEYRFSTFVSEIVKSDAFQLRPAPGMASDGAANGGGS
jgi:hypothetical protein